MKYLSVKEEIQKQRVSIDHISTSDNIADPLTKGLSPKTLWNVSKRWVSISKIMIAIWLSCLTLLLEFNKSVSDFNYFCLL